MGFWSKVGKIASVVVDKAPEVLATLAAEGAKKQEEAQKRYGKQISEYERKLEKAEGNANQISAEQREKLRQARAKFDAAKEKRISKGVQVTNSGQMLYGGKSLQQWDREWQSIGYLNSANLTPYNKFVGLYRHKIGGKVIYVGRAIELHNGGFSKRLSDYRRDSNSARKHKSGQLINENLDQITTDVLIVGDTEEAVQLTKVLEIQFIVKYNPSWNKQNK